MERTPSQPYAIVGAAGATLREEALLGEPAHPGGIVQAPLRRSRGVLVCMCGDSDWLLNDVRMTVEHRDSHEIVVGMATPGASVPRFDAFALPRGS